MRPGAITIEVKFSNSPPLPACDPGSGFFQASALGELLSGAGNTSSADLDATWSAEMATELLDSVNPRRTSLLQLDAALAGLSAPSDLTFACAGIAKANAVQVTARPASPRSRSLTGPSNHRSRVVFPKLSCNNHHPSADQPATRNYQHLHMQSPTLSQ